MAASAQLRPVWNGANLPHHRRRLPTSERKLVSAPIPILKDEEQEHPVLSLWRSRLRDIAEALKDGNFNLRGLADVDPLDDATAARITRNINDYGCTLTSHPEASWDTSVCPWQGGAR